MGKLFCYDFKFRNYKIGVEDFNIMGQEEVMNVLEKNIKPMAITDISGELPDLGKKRIHVILTRLLKFDEIKCIEIPRDLAMKMYHVKRRMKLYYC